jgi:microsomal epoxide hydrolase
MNTQLNNQAKTQPYTINVAQPTLDDLHTRLTSTRWADEIPGVGWDYGTERGKGKNPMPLMLVHGWPDSFYRMQKIIPMLTDPARFGGNLDDSLDVIVPSIPGYGFSDRPTASGMNSVRIAGLFTRLMAIAPPERLTGLHLTDIGFEHEAAFPTSLGELTAAEDQFLGATGYWFMSEGAYSMMQGTKPQTFAYSLNDSPVGSEFVLSRLSLYAPSSKFRNFEEGYIANLF